MGECFWPIVASTSIAIAFVGIIRLFSWNDKNRDDTKTILKRAAGGGLACLYGLCLAHIWKLPGFTLASQLGVKWDGLTAAVFLPLVLTVILFLGPLVSQFLDGTASVFATSQFWRMCFQDARWYRNLILAPMTEEVAFQACALPLLLHCFSPEAVYFVGPVAFSLAHLHHIPDLMCKGSTFAKALMICAFQAAYTYVFGIYSSFIFIRTGHILAPILCHSFCNHMGFPNFEELFEYEGWRRYLLWVAFVGGASLWFILLCPLTDPVLYGGSQFLELQRID